MALLAALLLPSRLGAQVQPPSEKLLINSAGASTWLENGVNVIEVEGPVTIEMDRAQLSASAAVIWLEPVAEGMLDEKTATIALIGDAKVQQAEISRQADRLLV